MKVEDVTNNRNFLKHDSVIVSVNVKSTFPKILHNC